MSAFENKIIISLTSNIQLQTSSFLNTTTLMNDSTLNDILGPQFSFAPEGGTDQADEWESIKMAEHRQQYTHFSEVDYLVGKDGNELSYAQIETVEQGFQWLQRRHPTYPNEVLMCMARAQFTPRPTEKQPLPQQPRAKAKSVFSIDRPENGVEVRFDMAANKSESETTDEQ